MKTGLTYLLLIAFIGITSEKPYTCEFGKLYSKSSHYKSIAPKPEDILAPRRMLVGGMQQMRITLNTDHLDAVETPVNGDETTLERLVFLKKAMQVAAYFFQSRLKVSTQSSIPIPSTCHDFSPPATDVSNGIGASDMHIYVRQITDNTLGYGATGVSCSWSSSSVTYPDTTFKAGKPLAGRMIFNTYNLIDQESTLTNRLFASITATALHETLHILGFDESLYQYYMDGSGNLHTGMLETVTLHASRSDNSLLKTPFVTTWAKDFFGCDSITGMPLENEDGGTHGSHWERLAVYDEIMTGTSLGAQKSFTALTFALLKDMGWYQVDDTFNDTTNYGLNKGCDFFNKACYDTTPDAKYFCNEASMTNVSECSTTFTGKATCSDQAGLMSDGCGMFTEYFHCVDPDANGDGYYSYTLEDFRTDSFCVKSTLATVGITNTYRGRCYPFSCDYDALTIEFTVGPYTVYCLPGESGTNKTVSALQGSIQCPVFADFCTNSRKICPNWCSQHGFCLRGICNCYSDDSVTYSGQDCSITTCTAANEYYNPATSSCTTACPSQTYPNVQAKTCLPCADECGECRDEATICTSCVSTPANPQYYDEVSEACVSQCPDGTFLDTDDRCKACDAASFCATCQTAATQCLSCTNSYFLTSSIHTCTPTCTYSSFLIRDIINMQCVNTCPNELYNNLGDGTCEHCPGGQYIVIDQPGNTCVGSCSDGYYVDEDRKVCDNCDTSCEKCFDKYPENCTECKTTGVLNYLYESMCVETCPGGYFQNSVAKQCSICDVTLHCSTCSDHSGTLKCDTCKYGYYLHTDNTCSISCGLNTYANMWNSSCDPCHDDCEECTGPYETQCVSCGLGLYSLTNSSGGFCLSDCPDERYVRGTSTCDACHESCLTCSGMTSANCQSCPEGFYLEAGKCRYVCSASKYPNSTTFTCENCHNNCQFCFGQTTNNCTACAGGLYLYSSTCQSSCPENHSPNSYGVCEINSELILQALGMIVGVSAIMMLEL